ncbi:MAG: c-type cytochrome domain-containing protein, partial [Planctomycetota bacterium]|nr:c-type cytochrome domain-containing protein [Planctomycetota bacterium]
MNPLPFRQFVSIREPGTLGVGHGLACIVSAAILLTVPVKVVAADKPKAEAITFKDHVKPILRQYCLKCHGNDEQNADLNLQTYATLLKGGSGGAVVKPGRPTASVLFQAITAT